MIDTATPFFPMPGLTEIERSLENQLGASSEYLDHIVISGPRGVGKSYFVQIAKEYLWHNEAKEFDCESISKEDLENWKSIEVKDKKLIILENLENFPLEETRALSSLLKRVRVVATTRDVLPEEFTDKFKISIDVPPLHKRRDDIFYFIAKKYPSLVLTDINLILLYANHWPGNFRELDKVLQRLSADHNLPTDFEISEDKLHRLFLTLYENGLQAPDLLLAHDTCFSHILPMEDGGGLFSKSVELKFQNNDSSCDIEALIGRYLSNTILDGNEIRWIFKCFFDLIYGRGTTLLDQNIFEMQPFTAESYEIIEQAQKDVDQWKLGDSYSSDYDFIHSYFQHFSKSLKQEEIDAANSYLKACVAACSLFAGKKDSETPTLITVKHATEEGQLDRFHLLRMAEKDAETLELLLYVRYEDIIKAASLPDLTESQEFGDYLVLPNYFITPLIESQEINVQTFLVSKIYPHSVGLLDIRQCLAGSGEASNPLITTKPYSIRLDRDLEKIWVVRQQAEKFYKKSLEKTPLPLPQELPVSSKPKTVNAAEVEGHDRIKSTISPIGKKDEERVLTCSTIKAYPVGGAPKASITEVVEWAYDKLSKSGNTEIIKRGKIRAFLQYLKECITEGNSNYSDYVAKRIIEIRAVDSACKITMQDLTPKEKLRMASIGKHTIIYKNRVSTILSELRKNKKS